MRAWTIREENFLRDTYETMTAAEIANAIGRTKSSVKNHARSIGLKLPEDEANRRASISRFPKGHVPYNKGTRGLMASNSGCFQKGHVPKNTKHDEAITIRQKKGDPPYKYFRVIVGKWMLLHRYLWEQVNGPIPPKHVLRFKDGDTINCELDNLELISMSKNMTMNQNRDKQSIVMKEHWAKVRRYESLGMPMRFTKHRTKRKQTNKKVVAIPMGEHLTRISDDKTF